MAIDFEDMVPLLQVFDMPVSIRFYKDILGFQVVTDSGGGDHCDWVWLRRGGMNLMLNTAYEADTRPAVADPDRAAAHADTALFFSCRAVDEALEHLLLHGVASERPKTAPYGMRQLYVTDPDGYVLCFQCPAVDLSHDAPSSAA
jgi:catechol 2,3-dioxygenase-like lactoylglutathione lyase family enzyme